MAPRGPAGGLLYLLHLEAPVNPRRPARHYLGQADDLDTRLAAHAAGRGARKLAAAAGRGIGWLLARTWDDPGDKAARLALERRKARHGPTLCPECNPRALRNGTLAPARRRTAAVAWPRPRRYGRYLDEGGPR
jgi:hypothetical protein